MPHIIQRSTVLHWRPRNKGATDRTQVLQPLDDITLPKAIRRWPGAAAHPTLTAELSSSHRPSEHEGLPFFCHPGYFNKAIYSPKHTLVRGVWEEDHSPLRIFWGYSWRSWGSQWQRDLSKPTQLGNVRCGIWTSSLLMVTPWPLCSVQSQPEIGLSSCRIMPIRMAFSPWFFLIYWFGSPHGTGVLPVAENRNGTNTSLI